MKADRFNDPQTMTDTSLFSAVLASDDVLQPRLLHQQCITIGRHCICASLLQEGTPRRPYFTIKLLLCRQRAGSESDRQANRMAAVLRNFTEDEEEATAFFRLVADHAVMPCALHDVYEDAFAGNPRPSGDGVIFLMRA